MLQVADEGGLVYNKVTYPITISPDQATVVGYKRASTVS